jgi:hypothetical protein
MRRSRLPNAGTDWAATAGDLDERVGARDRMSLQPVEERERRLLDDEDHDSIGALDPPSEITRQAEMFCR